MSTFWRLRGGWLLVLLLLGAGLFARPLPAVGTAQTEARCFAETQQCIAGRLRTFWEQNGGLPVFGYPITPQQEEIIEGQPFQVQWFERARLEWHPTLAPPYDVLLGRLGADRLARQGRDAFCVPVHLVCVGSVCIREKKNSAQRSKPCCCSIPANHPIAAQSHPWTSYPAPRLAAVSARPHPWLLFPAQGHRPPSTLHYRVRCTTSSGPWQAVSWTIFGESMNNDE